MTDRRFRLLGWDIRNLERKANYMERYFSEALYRSGKFVACLLLVILTSCALLFWQDSKLVNLVNGSMANLTDNMQSMAIRTEDLTLLLKKLKNWSKRKEN